MDLHSIADHNNLLVVKLSALAQLPSKATKLSAGLDLKSAQKTLVPAKGSTLVSTDIQVKLPSGTYGRVAPRSGLALNHKIDVGAGVIDNDYRGNIGVLLFNHGERDFTIEIGDRIAQLICEKISYPKVVEVKTLDESDRGSSGFGSTGRQ